MQKNLGKKKSSGGRKNAANKHGKGGRVTKKGTVAYLISQYFYSSWKEHEGNLEHMMMCMWLQGSWKNQSNVHV